MVNSRKLAKIEMILNKYYKYYENIYVSVKGDSNIPFYYRLLDEYYQMVENKNSAKGSTINLYFVKRAIKAYELIETVRAIREMKYVSESEWLDNYYYFIYNNENFFDILKEYAFNVYLTEECDKELKEIIDEFINNDCQLIKTMSN